MSLALSSGVTGLQAHQKMLDVAGNNLANVNTTAFKTSTVNFAELLSQTVQEASQPTGNIGGTNPEQMGTGVGVAGVVRKMEQGNIVNTGNPLDVAIEGEGYFSVTDGQRALYTRAGTFGIDAQSMLVDLATGYRVQRIGLTGEADGFQVAGNSGIRIPFGVAMPAAATSKITVSGNLSSDATGQAQAQVLTSSLEYTYDGGTEAAATTEIDQLDQFSGGGEADGQLSAGQSGAITISGYQPDGTPFAAGLSFAVDPDTTVGDLIDHLNTNVLSGAVASLVNGQICITDAAAGASRSDIALSYSGDGELETPPYFELTTVGGEEVRSINIAVYDSQGGKHVLSAALVRTDAINTWDMIVTAVTGRVDQITPENRRINGIMFDARTGAYRGLPESESGKFTITFEHDTATPQEITLNFGTNGGFDGLTQFAGNSTAVAREQDGYEAGELSSVSVDSEGTVVGAFSNGVRKDIAALGVALFANPSGLESAGSGYLAPSSNSGQAVATRALASGAGAIHGGALEKSNADVAAEFVSLIQAQNGFQANARTIRVANEILQELTNLIR